jgi:hypothetical protein
MQIKKTYKILTVLLVMQWAFVQLIGQYPSFIETYYANGLYPIISNMLQFAFSWLPFSFGDLLYSLLIFIIIKKTYSLIKNKKIEFKTLFFKIGAYISVLFFMFHFNWGLNYFRQPVYKNLNFEVKPYSINELTSFTEKLIKIVNQTQVSITKNDTVLVENPLTKEEIRHNSYEVYNQLKLKFPQFKYSKLRIKNSLFSTPLTYMGFGGYLNPFTNETQANILIPKNSYTATVCHELAHQIGIAPESEANFVGYLAATNSNDNFFKYSGYLNALRYCLSEIYYKDLVTFELLKAKINTGVLKDIQQSQDFWESYQNWSEKYFKTFYDSFLKANQQKDGIKSYNKMLVLLINYYKTVDFQ